MRGLDEMQESLFTMSKLEDCQKQLFTKFQGSNKSDGGQPQRSPVNSGLVCF